LWIAAVWLLFAIWCLIFLGSCSNSTEPGSDPILRITYNPPADNVVLLLDDELLFHVNIENGPGAVVTFCRGDSLLTTGTNFLYQGIRIGTDSLCANVTMPDTTYSKNWRIWVDAENATLPPLVPQQTVGHGPVPSSIVVTWVQPSPHSVPRPLQRYYVGINYNAMVTDANWDEALIIDTVEHLPGQTIGYSRTYNADQMVEILPGQEVWVGVRVEDQAGLLSPLSESLSILITLPYSLQGYVRDDQGHPLHGVIVDYGCDTCKTATDVNGWFELGPFRDIDKYVFTTISQNENSHPDTVDAYYDFQTDSLEVETPQPLEIMLIGRRGLDPGCTDDQYSGDFLSYLRQMTRTDRILTIRPNYDLLKWDSYPLNVYVNAALNLDETFAMDSLAVEALAIWNEKMDEDYFVQVDQVELADIEIIFTMQGLYPNHGLTEIMNEGRRYRINEVIPQKMHVLVLQSLNEPEYTLEVILHELGHALCMGDHSYCGDLVHLMWGTPGGIIAARWPESPINDDEAAAVRVIRYLPQATPMNQYISE